jgi:hypothetical protein
MQCEHKVIKLNNKTGMCYMQYEYRIIKLKDKTFIVGEVYYNENNIVAYCDSPVEISGENIEELKNELEYIKEAFNLPILIEKDNDTLIETNYIMIN